MSERGRAAGTKNAPRRADNLNTAEKVYCSDFIEKEKAPDGA